MENLKSKAGVLRYLLDSGYEISRSQFYAHCADGLLKKSKSKGVYTPAAIKRYAKLHVKRADTGEKEISHSEKLATLKKEVALKREQVRLAREEIELRKLSGKSMPVEEHELGMVARGITFLSHLQHMALIRVADYIELVAGDQDRAAALVDAMLEDFEKRMSVFSTTEEFEIILEGDKS